jgi:deazaflavin-dependent oxidoreductase (nitroreductase family)
LRSSRKGKAEYQRTMIKTDQVPYLYLTTIGWKSGEPHEIEIWFTTFRDRYYVISEKRERSHWVQNIRHNPIVAFRIDEHSYTGTARVVEATDEPDLSQHISNLSSAKYDWGDGLVVELTPNQGEAR